jgi:mycothiol synthase
VTPTVSRAVPDESTRLEIRRLAAAVEAEDGAPPLSDQTLTQLGSPDVDHLLAREGSTLVGYAQVEAGGAEIAGLAAAAGPLLEAAGPELIWSHGRRSRLVPELERQGFVRTRELLQLRRPADEPLPADPPLPADVAVRAFEPGRDDAAWLALNAAAFAHHPEQGRMTRSDLDARMAEEWFDPAGFLLAERAGELVAFHWTKIHPDGTGEVYVLGVAPSAQGTGLGGALLTRGLRHLYAHRCPAVILYVEGDNAPAVHLYERDGFRRFDLDIQWRTGTKPSD